MNKPRRRRVAQRSVPSAGDSSTALAELPDTPESDTPAHTSSPAATDAAYRRLTTHAKGQILRYHADGLDQTQIAQLVGCHQSTVSRCLHDLGFDSTELAQARLKASALDIAERVVKVAVDANPREAMLAAKLAFAASGVTKEDSGAPVNVAVVIGLPNQGESGALSGNHAHTITVTRDGSVS